MTPIDVWEPNEIDADAEVVVGSLDGEVLPLGDPSVTSLVNRALAYPVPGVKARVGVQEHYILSATTQTDVSTKYRWVLAGDRVERRQSNDRILRPEPHGSDFRTQNTQNLLSACSARFPTGPTRLTAASRSRHTG